jgi:hypothetical protein
MRSLPIFVSVLIAGHAAAQAPTAGAPSTQIDTLEQLVRMNECQLLDLYRQAQPGAIPSGFTPGRMISNPGKRTTVIVSRMTERTLWQGKIFGDDGIMTNRMFGVRFIKGEVQTGESWLDGKPSNIIDYSQTSRIFRPYRDEFREVSPGIYLGIMYKRDCCNPKIVTYFALDARGGCCQAK